MISAILAVRCHYCSKFRSPSEVLHLGTGGAVMCWTCYEWHAKALRMLQGEPPPGCQVCGVTFAQLKDATPGEDVRMYVVPKDSLYQVLCKTCSDAYIRKRVDLLGDTQFGWENKLKGAK